MGLAAYACSSSLGKLPTTTAKTKLALFLSVCWQYTAQKSVGTD